MLIDQTVAASLAAEAAIERLYRNALDEWVVRIEPFVLPSLTASGELPPDPDAAANEQSSTLWMQIADGLILGGLSTLWAVTMIDALQQSGQEIPEAPAEIPAAAMPDEAAIGVVADELDIEREEARRAVMAIEGDPALRAKRDEIMANARDLVSRTPQTVLGKMTSAVKDLTDGAEITARMREVVVPDSPEMADIARLQSDVAASVQNDAVIQAAVDSGDEGLEKVWIATLDSKTRRTHWAADGQRVPLNGTFAIGRDDLRYPVDPRGSDAETRNCRCRVGIQNAEDALPAEVDRHTERLDGRDSTARNREGSQEDEVRRRIEADNPRARDPITAASYSAGGWVAPSEAVYEIEIDTDEETDSMDREDGSTATLAADDADTTTEDGSTMFRTFTDSVVAVTGEHTSDGRMLAADIDMRFRTMPLPLMWVKQSSMGHLDAFTVGVIESSRVEDGVVYASGYLMNSAEADEAAEQIAHGITGPSVDLADTEWILTDEDGKEISEEEMWDLPMDAKVYQTVTSAELIGTTLVSTPAFGQTTISLNSERESRDVSLVASAAADFRPRTYAAAMFADPQLTAPTPIQMGDDGRIFGHLACFGECHRTIQAECVMVPRSSAEYSQFLTSPPVRLDDGRHQPVGRLTVGTGHCPDPNASAGVAAAHYDNTGSCFALVNVGEDAHGVWISGVAAPWATAEQIEMGLAAPLSGDWRAYRGRLELVAALAVNTPGYVVRGATDNMGRPKSLVASMGPSRDDGRPATMSREDVADIVRQTIQLTREEDAKAHRVADVSGLLSKVPDTRAADRKAEIDDLFSKAGA
ncbi:capsid maturation protease and MuF-like fusion protein [Gordonia phage Mariokart]|nr:capsid maturation protease and MuF-like fusion protein [Gordonia phage Mariokart]